MSSKFSPFIIKALVDTITGGSGNDPNPPIGVYRSGPKIEQFFLDCGIDMRIGSQSRVPATTDIIRQTRMSKGGDTYIKNMIVKVCDPREYIDQPEKGIAVREHINTFLESDGFEVGLLGGKAYLKELSSAGFIVRPFLTKVDALDFDTVQL